MLRLFDTLGRRPVIAGTYLISAVLTVVLGLLWSHGSLTVVSFMALIVAVFFFASAGASAAYLTVSEIFPMETRALAIAFFCAVGTAAGGIIGPVLFGNLIQSGHVTLIVDGFYVGAVVMAIGGIAEIVFGVQAEGRALESIARPPTAVRSGAAGLRERVGRGPDERGAAGD